MSFLSHFSIVQTPIKSTLVSKENKELIPEVIKGVAIYKKMIEALGGGVFRVFQICQKLKIQKRYPHYLARKS